MSQSGPAIQSAREALDVIDRLQLRELNPTEAGRWLLRLADRLEPEAGTRLRSAAEVLVTAMEELRQVREDLIRPSRERL